MERRRVMCECRVEQVREAKRRQVLLVVGQGVERGGLDAVQRQREMGHQLAVDGHQRER